MGEGHEGKNKSLDIGGGGLKFMNCCVKGFNLCRQNLGSILHSTLLRIQTGPDCVFLFNLIWC